MTPTVSSPAPARVESTRRLPWPIRIALAPVLLLERTKGRRRWALLALYGVAFAVFVAAYAPRAILHSLPDPGDPLEGRKSTQVRMEVDALRLYREAADGYRPYPLHTGGDMGPQYVAEDDWNREAIRKWRAATEANDWSVPLAGSPLAWRGGTSADEEKRFALALGELARIAADHANVLIDRPGESWAWQRAILRFAAQSQARLDPDRVRDVPLGDGHSSAMIDLWIDYADRHTSELRLAMIDVMNLRETAPGASLRLEWAYDDAMRKLRAPSKRTIESAKQEMMGVGAPSIMLVARPLVTEVRWHLRDEPERARRVVRHCFANWLTHCDQPANGRPKRSKAPPFLYEQAGKSTGGFPTLSSNEVAEWYDASELARYALNEAILVEDRIKALDDFYAKILRRMALALQQVDPTAARLSAEQVIARERRTRRSNPSP